MSAPVLLALNLLACGTGGQGSAPADILRESWRAYVQRFIQNDGRVIDYRAHGISTSEGQAYAMLRAVWMNDRATFDKTYVWAVHNLNMGSRTDHLWAWKWGQDAGGKWHALDRAFATDADQDAALALILASKTWNEPRYLRDAQATLADLWRLAVVSAGGRRYLLAGDSLCKADVCRVNPSYYAPYAYRIFATFDKAHEWASMAGASYSFLEQVSGLTATRLPPDWVELDKATGAVRLASAKDSQFSYDALRVFWRVALDYDLYRDARASSYLNTALLWLRAEWQKTGQLAAVISSSGKPVAEYQSLEMLAAVTPAMRLVAPDVAAAMESKLRSAYSQGAWGERDSYYLQNWAWFGAALDSHYLGPFEKVRR